MTAEFGKVRNVGIGDLQAGMKVHRDVVGRNNKVLVSAGEILSHKHVKQLQKWEAKEQPLGPALKKKNPKNRMERVDHAPFEGGWRPSHFNPRGIPVSATLSSGDEAPAVDRDPTKSPLFQNAPKASISVPVGTSENEPRNRREKLNTEIEALCAVNEELSGTLCSTPPEDRDLSEAGLVAFRDDLKLENKRLIIKLREPKNGNGHDAGKISMAKAASRGGRVKSRR